MMYKRETMKIKLQPSYFLKILFFFILSGFFLSGCNGIPGADARKFPDDPKLRVKKNMEEGRGFRVNDALKNRSKGGVFEFASSNELWRASLDVIDFMPLLSVDYGGGVIITDWYSEEGENKDSEGSSDGGGNGTEVDSGEGQMSPDGGQPGDSSDDSSDDSKSSDLKVCSSFFL